MAKTLLTRRQILARLGGSFGLLGVSGLLSQIAAPSSTLAASGVAKRVIIFYFPDGVAGQAQDGSPSLWHPRGSESNFELTPQLEPLAAHKGDCVFFTGLSSGTTDSGSHPGGAKKLLTAVDGGQGESIDQYLARTAGGGVPFRHLYLGAASTQNNASGDKHISYAGPGTTVPPDDDPRRVFGRLFPGKGGMPMQSRDELKISVLDTVLADMNELSRQLGSAEKAKLDLHLAALREVEQRVKGTGGGTMEASCQDPRVDLTSIMDGRLFDPATFPAILRAQMDLMVLSMACGLTKVGVLQASMHTSELIMSRFPGTEMYEPGFDMRSHQASHYGASHDMNKREFRSFLQQRRWFVSQFAYLLAQLKARPEPGAMDGTMLDHSLVLLCSEVCDGNTHSHDNLPFILAGRAGGRIRTGRLLQYGYRRHADLLLSMAHAMGQTIPSFGHGGSGVLPGLLS